MSEGVLHRFYCSKEWKNFREMIIQDRSKDGVKCEECRRFIFKGEEIHIHHTPVELTEKNYKDKMVSLNPDNVKMICRGCHDKAHNRFCGGHKRRERAVYIVCGPPMAGKTTYVRQNMESGDIVVDMDKLYEAVSLCETYNKPECLKYNVFAIKNAVLNQIKTRYGGFKNAWVVGGYANKVEREKLAVDLGAEIVLIDITKEECMKSLEHCMDYRQKHKSEWKQYIDRWFEEYS